MQHASHDKLKILILHNAYQQVGGEDAVMRNEVAMLRDAGHEVFVEIVDNAEIRSFGDKVSAMVKVAYNRARVAWTQELLDRVRPDVVQIHNFFPLLTLAVHETVYRSGIPVIQTLHNYRLACAKGTFERDGKVCELCLEDRGVSALRYRCYRGSLPGTAALVYMQHRARSGGLITQNVDTFIAVTEFARAKYIEMGLPPAKLVVKPNFVDRPVAPDPDAPREGALFVGRLSHEKGVTDLIEAWKQLPDIPLTVAGDGPMRRAMEAAAPANVRFLGRVDGDRIEVEMTRAKALVIPSIWYEGFPVTLVESFASALPAIATRIGSLAEVVVDGVNGFHCDVKNPDSLRDTVRKFFADPQIAPRMSAAARRSYEELYSRETNLGQLERIFREAIARAAGRSAA